MAAIEKDHVLDEPGFRPFFEQGCPDASNP
jgi:hypothetical protein